MSAKELPTRPHLEQYKKQAKELLKACQAGGGEARERMRRAGRSLGTRVSLAGAQWVIAREHGFESWAQFRKHIQSRTPLDTSAAIWEAAQNAVIRGDEAALESMLASHGAMLRGQEAPPYGASGLRPDYSTGDARAILVREHHFEDWEKFAEYRDALRRPDSAVAQFEAAVDAIVDGRTGALERLLRKNPRLVRACSLRKHRSTLLHYAGSNGVESFRQKCPRNIAAVTQLLLQAGAAVDAEADMYGGGQTALGLAATSIHPVRARVLIPLLETLLEAGASIDGALVNACLGNGRAQAAEFLARRGASLDLEGAAGVGRIELVKSFFEANGSRKPGVTAAQMKDAFAWACEFGRTPVVEFLLDRGMDIRARLRHDGQTGLHWAALCAQVDTVQLLLQRKAPVNTEDETYHGTPLSWALYGWKNPPPGIAPQRYHRVAALLVAAGASVKPEWLADERIRADRRMLAALQGGAA